MLDLISCHPRVDPNLLDRAGRMIMIVITLLMIMIMLVMTIPILIIYRWLIWWYTYDNVLELIIRQNSSPPCRLPWQPFLPCSAPQHGRSPGQPNQITTIQAYSITTSPEMFSKEPSKYESNASQLNLVSEQEGEGVLHRACRSGALEEVDHLWNWVRKHY